MTKKDQFLIAHNLSNIENTISADEHQDTLDALFTEIRFLIPDNWLDRCETYSSFEEYTIVWNMDVSIILVASPISEDDVNYFNDNLELVCKIAGIDYSSEFKKFYEDIIN